MRAWLSVERAAVSLLALGLVFLAGCQVGLPSQPSIGNQPTTGAGTLVRVVTVKEELQAVPSYSGDVRPLAQVTLVAKVPGRLQELKVDVGDEVKKGDLLAVVEHKALEAQVKQAEAGLALARARLAKMERGPRKENVAVAKANLRQAEARLAALKAGPTKHQIEAAEAAVRAAKNQLYAVQAQADAAMASPLGAYTEEMKQAQSGAAYEQVRIAEAKLAALTAPPTKEQLDQAEAAVEAARQQLLLAQNPFTPQDLESARAQVAQAQAALQLAQAQLGEAFIQAPLDGVVSERFLSLGAMAGPTAPILTLVSSQTEVVFSAEESVMGQLAVGQPVSITVSAYPEQVFAGQVSSIAPTVDPRTRTFKVKVSPQDPGGRLKPGMFARVDLGPGGQQIALRIPSQALIKRGEETFVFVVAEGRARLHKVKVSAREGGEAVVLEGLSEGDRVVIEGQGSLKDGDPVRVR
jgi:RND family efflux transporter MFP subunit